MTRFSPTWWAAWTCGLHRPGRLDDEEVPAWVDGALPTWLHCPPWYVEGARPVDGVVSCAPWDRNRRPDWPTLVHTQNDRAPLPTDGCALHCGRCSGTCGAAEALAARERGRRRYVAAQRRGFR